ncbi:hypothetical protein FKM82_004048 [Ascaphus truei]
MADSVGFLDRLGLRLSSGALEETTAKRAKMTIKPEWTQTLIKGSSAKTNPQRLISNIKPPPSLQNLTESGEPVALPRPQKHHSIR